MKITDVITEAASPAQQAAIAISMKKAGKKPRSVDEDLTRRGFLRGLGAAAVAGAAGSALAGTDDLDFPNKVQKMHSDMMEKNPQYAKEHEALGIALARGFVGAAAENNKRWYQKTAELLQKYGVKVNEGMTEGSESDAYGNTGEKHECGSCDGTGIVSYDELAKAAEYDDVCPECGGKGWVRDKESLKKKGVAEAYQFKGGFPFDVDHMNGPRGINLPSAPTKKFFTDKQKWSQTVDDINSSKYNDNSEYTGVTGRSTVSINGHEWARWSDAQQKGYIELSSMSEQDMAEEASPMIKPPANRFDNKQEAFDYAKEHGGKVFKSTYIDPNTGIKNIIFVVKKEQGVVEGSGPKEKQKTPYRDINSPEYRAAADKQKQRMAKDKAAEPGKKLLAKKGVAEGNDDHIWGSQGRFAGDTHVNVGGDVMNMIQVGDVVKYFGQKAEVVAMSKDRKRARITRGGITQDVNTSDLIQLGQGMAEESSENKYSNLSNRGVNRGINRAADDFDRMMDLDQVESPHYKTQHQQATKQRLKTRPMAGPKGVLPEQGVAEHTELAEEFDLIESIVEMIAEHNGVDAEVVWADLESLTEDELYVFAVTSDPLMEDWQKANKRDRTDGMSQKAVNAYRRENPGSKLKTAVTTKPSKLKKGGKASKRRKSYCSRSRGQMKMHSISCAKTPDKAICKARRRWNC